MAVKVCHVHVCVFNQKKGEKSGNSRIGWEYGNGLGNDDRVKVKVVGEQFDWAPPVESPDRYADYDAHHHHRPSQTWASLFDCFFLQPPV